MKRIKFKVWNKNLKIFTTDFCIDANGDLHYIGDNSNVNQEDLIVLQYSGIEDIEGKEIYEGDIVIINETFKDNSSFEYDPVVIVWKKYEFGFDDMKSNLSRKCHWLKNLRLSEMTKCEFKVIGNIYENSDLI